MLTVFAALVPVFLLIVLGYVLRRILLVTGIFEGAGAALLTVLFWAGGDTLGQALWRGVFTAISAFCNAGFALQSDSLVGYQTAPLVLWTSALIVGVGC